MTKKKFYVTTPIYYPNDILHVGHAYTTLAADILARWHRLKGEDVFFLTGTDEHGKKIQEAADKAGKKPREFVDELVLQIKKDWGKLDLTYDKFIRTTDKGHEKIVREILQKVYDKGDIYLGEYEGFYCVPCEAYYTEKDLENGNCPIHKKKVELLKEKSYFFKLSKYQKKLLDLYKTGFILPKNREKEIVNRVKEGLNDLSISRTSFDWGIKLPFDEKHICYVWFDALTNYYSATREKGKEKYWPADVHLIGKDILWFHAVYWPAMLMSAGIELPKKVFAHGWWTFDKEKISKSRGKVINIDELISIAGLDSIRYFLFRATPFGDDGDFSKEAVIERHNNELADKLGNLVSRVSALAEKIGVEKTKENLFNNWKVLHEGLGPENSIDFYLDNFEFDKALNQIFSFIDYCNEYIQNKRPWETKDKKVLFELVEAIRKINPYLGIFMPETAKKIEKIFKTDKIKKAEVLFKKIE
jgi:methionyl-tRNA synthetase